MMDLFYPVTTVILTQGFGENPAYYSDERQHPGWSWPGHNGLDFGGALGDPILAAAEGVVTRAAFEEGGYGHYVRLTHANGWLTYYAHLSQVTVRLNQHVQAGEHLGAMGASGCADGVHLHFGLRLPSDGPAGYAGYTDPSPYFSLPFREGRSVPPIAGIGSSLTERAGNGGVEVSEGVEGKPLPSTGSGSEGETFPEPTPERAIPGAVEGVEAGAALASQSPFPFREGQGVGFPSQGRVRVCVDILNIRAAPALDAAIVGALYAGAHVVYTAVVENDSCVWLELGGLFTAAVCQDTRFVTFLS